MSAMPLDVCVLFIVVQNERSCPFLWQSGCRTASRPISSAFQGLNTIGWTLRSTRARAVLSTCTPRLRHLSRRRSPQDQPEAGPAVRRAPSSFSAQRGAGGRREGQEVREENVLSLCRLPRPSWQGWADTAASAVERRPATADDVDPRGRCRRPQTRFWRISSSRSRSCRRSPTGHRQMAGRLRPRAMRRT